MSDQERNPRLVHASLSRMGTMSMAQAYRILGFRPHHYHQLENPDKEADWPAFSRAVDGKWPHVDGAEPGMPPFERKDWDALLGDKWDFFTDFYAHFSLDHVEAYPEAKVIVVERDFDSWWPSYYQICLEFLHRPSTRLIALAMRYTTKASPIESLTRQYKGFFDVKDLRKLDEDRAREKHAEFFQAVREAVPAERRLDYRIGDGWEPLCKFLDKPVPDVPFPRLNERAVLLGKYQQIKWAISVLSGSLLMGVVGVVWVLL